MLAKSTNGKIAMLTSSVLMLAACATIAGSPSEFTVHEWGTFLAMSGSDGVTLDGMYHEEHSLPGFVHARSKDQLKVPAVSVKGETPVIYFYTDQPRNVKVRVKFPQGIWTQWYPQAQYNGPSTAQAGSPPDLKNGHITWQVRVSPPATTPSTALPKTPPGSLWDYARDVDAAYVRPNDQYVKARGERERFIFYRGLGAARLPLQMTAGADPALTYDQDQPLPLRHLFVICVEHGRAAYRYIPEMQPRANLRGVLPSMAGAMFQQDFEREISYDLANRLTEAGLYAKEARAMVNTWRHSYFETEGIRVLFVLPQEWTERFIPMEIEPAPSRLVRVMVGRLEVLTPQREQAAATAIRGLSSRDSADRERAYAFLKDQGRYLEPIVRRTLKSASDESTRLACRRLLTTDLVTELRAASTDGGSAGNHEQLDQLDARAQLAALLLETGLKSQAADEARRVLSEIDRIPQPGIANAEFRIFARIRARCMEALGDDAGAAKWYTDFVKYGSQSAKCGGCHQSQGPTGLAWYRDWWAGAKFAQYATKHESVDSAIDRRLAALKANPGDTAARMMLAYLYAQKGDGKLADAQWARLTGAGLHQVSKSE